jgi:ankyrin repeat protein
MVWVPILMDVDPVEAVMSAAEDADMECLRMVLDRAPDLVVGRGVDGQTALMLAAKRGHSEVVQLLLETGAVLGALDHDGRSAVHYAACNGHTQLLPSLLATRADASRRDRNERTPLMLAACEGHVDAVWSLLGLHGFGADVVNARDVHGETALWKASGKGHYDVARLLLRAGADPHVPDLWEYKAMEVAGRYADVLKLIRVRPHTGHGTQNDRSIGGGA